MVTDDDDQRDAGRRETMHTDCQLTLMRGRWVARLVGITGEHDEIDLSFDRLVEGVFQTGCEVKHTCIETGCRVEPAVGLYADVGVGNVQESDRHGAPILAGRYSG